MKRCLSWKPPDVRGMAYQLKRGRRHYVSLSRRPRELADRLVAYAAATQ
jgi:hypothetical protein